MDIFYLPKQVAVDSTGAPLAGAKLYFYQAGTTTPTDTYTTSARSVAHTNPVVADSEGVFDAIYLGTTYNYKAVLKTSGDVTVWTQDNIANASVLGSLLAAGSVPTAAIANEAITLAKMADLARGSFIVGGASDRPTALVGKTDGKIPMGDGTDITMVSPPLPKGYKYGFTLSLDTDTDHDILVAAGVARDNSDSVNIVGSAMTKQIDATWAEGDDAGGLFSGTVANSTTYYFFAIVKDSDSSVDYGFDTSSTAANIPSGYTKYLLLDTLLTDDSANLINSMNGYYTSGAQTITQAGALTLAHGLPSTPKAEDCFVYLTNVTTEAGFTAGQEFLAQREPPDNTTAGAKIKPDSSSLNIRYANAANTFTVIHETTGTATLLTNAKWTARFTAKVDV